MDDSANESKAKSSAKRPIALIGIMGLVAGLIVGLAVGMPLGINTGLASLPVGGETNGAESCEVPVTVPELTAEQAKIKAENFLNESMPALTGMDNMSAEVTEVNDEDDFYYSVAFNLLQDDAMVQEAQVYVTKEGGKIILGGSIFDLDEPLAEPTPEPTPELAKSDTPNVKMFVMSYCPYGQQAETGLKPAIELLGNTIDFEPHFVIYSDYASGYPEYCFDENNKYCSMHGISELNEDVRQLCIWKYEKDKFWDYVSGINANCSISEIETCWKEQAEKAGIDAEKIEQCFNEEALELLAAEKELNNQYGVSGSPTVLINETRYSGGRAPENYKLAICSAFNQEPEECSQELGDISGNASGQC